jgi:hypothetical protein
MMSGTRYTACSELNATLVQSSCYMLAFWIYYPQAQEQFWTFGTVCSISLGFSIFFDSGVPVLTY